MTESLCIGLMSGTSVDGIDAVLTGTSDNSITPPHIRLIAARCEPLSPGLRERILALTRPGDNEIDRLGALDVELGHCFADAALQVLRDANVAPEHIAVIGSHGQTVRHRPGGAAPFTLQIGDPNIIAERTGITTVADFRRRDMAAGGQGAPLVPAFHEAFFRSTTENRVLLNIGGMANVTLLPATNTAVTAGFDTGPGNVLLDAWHERHHGVALDRDGAWARSGQPHATLLTHLLADPWLGEPPPKSTGREHFGLDWLDDALKSVGENIRPVDVQATLTDLSARSIAEAIARWGGGADNIYVCGGGTHNVCLRERLAYFLPPSCRISSSAALGVDPDWMEAMAFAWLAHRTLAGLSGNLPAVTGARRPVILGGIYPGKPAGG